MTVTVNLDGTAVVMEVDTGASLSIMSYSFFCWTWPTNCSANIKSSEAWLHTYTREKIAVKGAVDVQVNYEKQEVNLVLTIVEGERPTLLGRDWLRRLQLNWYTLNHIRASDRSELQSILTSHSAPFAEVLGRIRGASAKLYQKEGEKPRF